MANKTRTLNIHFMANTKERELIEKRMEQAGMTSLRAYLLKMATDGQVVRIELDSVHEMVRLLSIACRNEREL